MESTTVESLVSAALEAVPPPNGMRVHCNIEPDHNFTTDPERLVGAISNLLTNAYRYGGPNISISASASADGVTICFDDDGPGVDSAVQTTLFEPFSRGESAPHKGGSGLGLAITRGIVEAAGGRVEYRNLRPRGASFRIHLPGGPS